MSIDLDKIDNIAEILKNFSNSNKLKVLCFIWKEEKNVGDIIKYIKTSQSMVSQILARMRLENIVTCKKRWKEVYYKISDKKTLSLITSLKKIFN